jgi:methyl-accepting chemotaxis protein
MIDKVKNMKLYHKMAVGFSLVGLILTIVVLITVYQVSSLMEVNHKVVNLRVPTARASLMMLNGMNHSLAALRGWIILGKDSFTSERLEAWDKEIEPSFQALQTFSQNWTNPENVARLQRITDIIQDFKRSQQEIEDIAQKDANVPALEMLFTQAAPQATILAQQITIMIDLEAELAGTSERKALLGVMADIRGTTGLGLAAIRAYLLSGDSKFRTQFETLWAKNSRRFIDLENTLDLLSAEQRIAFDIFSEARAIFSPLPSQMFTLREANDWNRANYWLKTKAAPTAIKMVTALTAMAADQEELMAADLITQEDMASSLFSLLWSLLACGLFASAILGFFISRSVIRPLMVVVNSLNEMSHGTSDLTQRLPITAPVCSDIKECDDTACPCYGKGDVACWEIRGSLSFNPTCPTLESGKIRHCEECEVFKSATYSEMQALCVNFNSFICKLQMILQEVVESVKTVSSATQELSNISDKMSDGAEHVSGQSDSVSVAAEEMSVNMNSVAAASEEATTNMSIVASAADEMTTTIADVNKNTDQASKVTGEAVSEAENATSRVQDLGKAASEISKVTEVITEISNQTNLLALNATIEAARAGEAGKGFAVVANEIKDLAKQTAEATGQIKTKIEGIQSSTSATVDQIERITNVINNINDTVEIISSSVDGQASATQEIAANVAEATHGLEEVNENVAQSSVVSSQIAKDISMVNSSSTEISDASSEVKKSAANLSVSAEKLKEMTEGFKL